MEPLYDLNDVVSKQPSVYGKGNVGKPRGIREQKIEAWNNFSDFCLTSGLRQFQEAMQQLPPAVYTDRFIKILEFHKPRLQRNEVTTNGKPTILLSFPNVGTNNPAFGASNSLNQGPPPGIDSGNVIVLEPRQPGTNEPTNSEDRSLR